MKKRLIIALGILIVLVATTMTIVLAHGGGLAADGCHTDHSTGTRHCHKAPDVNPPASTSTGTTVEVVARPTPVTVPIQGRGWPTTCVYLNDIAEAHLGNAHNVGIYQRTFTDPNVAEAVCRADHRDDVRRNFGWAFSD